ncbi:MAG: hypothetical protein LAP86_35000 [Acidobacteriia bacterium]|nr:hypothetical protein [Terriglobia bacterium]
MFRSSVAAFYALLQCLFYGFGDEVRRNRFAILVRRLLHPEVEKIVHRVAEILLAAEITFGGLDRCMTE